MTSRYMIDIQNRKSKIIHVYRNGDKYNRAALVLLRPIEQQKLERIFKAIEEKVTLPYNKPIKRIFSLKGNEIDDPIMIKDQKYYVVGSSENFINTRYGSIIKWTIIGPVKWSKFADVFYEPPAQDDMAVGNKILYRWKNNTTNSARLSTKMTKSMSAYSSDRKPLRNSKMMTLSMDQSKRPISEPSNDMKNVNKINNTENSFFHSSDEKNSSGDNSVTSPKILSNRNHKSMDQFLNDSLKMYQLNDGNSKEEMEIIDQPENDENKSEEKSEKIEFNMKNDSPVCLINIEENRLENELEDSEILNVHVDRKDNENSDELSDNIIENNLQFTNNDNADENLKIYDNDIPENQINESNENAVKSHEIKLEFDKANLESKNSEMLSDEENESHKIINPDDDVEPNSDEENSSSNENLVKDKSLINDTVLEEPLDSHIVILKKDNEEICEMGKTDFTDNARHSTEDDDKDNIYSDERNVDDENDDSVKIDSEISHTEEENEKDSDLKALENTALIQENVDSLSKEYSQAVQNDEEISENKVDEIMFTDSSNIDKQSLNNSTNDVQLFENTESNSDQEDGNAINDFSLNFEKSKEIKDLHELIKSPCSELNDDDIDMSIEEPLEQKQENCNEVTEDLKELSDSQVDNYKNELENKLENSGKYSTLQIQSDDNYRMNNKELNIEDNKNDKDFRKMEFDNEIESSEENDTGLEDNKGEINDIHLKKNIDSEIFSEENETDENYNDNEDYSSDKNEENEINITNENKFLNENIEFKTENQSYKDTEIKENDHSELCESISTKDENFDKLHDLLSKHSRSRSISDHDSSDNENFDNKFDDLNNNFQQNPNDIVNVKSNSDINPKEQFNRIDLKLSDSSDCFEENTNLPHTFSNQDDHKINDSLEQFNRIDVMLESPSNCINDKPKVVDSDNEIQNTNTFYENSTDKNNIEQYNRIDFVVDDSIGFITDRTKSLTDVSENDDSDLNEDDKISNVTKDSIEYIQANIKAETDTTENNHSSNNDDDNDDDDNNDDENQESETDTTENIHNSIKNDDDDYDDKQEGETTENLKLEINEESNENEIKIDLENVSDLLHKDLDEDEAARIIQKNFREHLVRNELTPHTEQINTDEVTETEMNNNENNSNSHNKKLMCVPDDWFQENKQELDEDEAARIIQKGFREHLVKNDFMSGSKQTDTDEEINSDNELNKKENVENSESLSENEDSERINAAKIIQKNVRGYIVRKDLSNHSANQYIEDLHSENEINDSKVLDKDIENDKSDASVNLPQLTDENITQNNAAKIIQKNFRGHLVRKELDHHRKHVDTEEDIESEGEQNRSYEQKDSEYDENDPDVNFSLMKDATNDLNTEEILDDHSQFDNSCPDDAFVVNNKL